MAIKRLVKNALCVIFYLVNLTVFMLLLLPAVTTSVSWWWLDNLLSLQVQWAFLALLLLLINLFMVKKLRVTFLFLYSVTITYNFFPLYSSPAIQLVQAGSGAAQGFTIAQINLSYDNPNLAQLLPTLGNPRFDLLVLQEASDKEFANIKKLTRYYPYSFGINDREATPSGLAILSRYPIIEKHLHDEGYKSGHILEVVLQQPDSTTPIQVYALHPGSPRTTALWQLRNQTLASIAERIVNSPFTYKIVIGDFNSSPWSGPFKRFQKTSQLKNSAQGFGYIPSWSYSKKPLLALFSSAYIDHCLVSPPFPSGQQACTSYPRFRSPTAVYRTGYLKQQKKFAKCEGTPTIKHQHNHKHLFNLNKWRLVQSLLYLTITSKIMSEKYEY